MKYQSSRGNDTDGGNHGMSWYMVEQEMMFRAIGVKHWHFHHLVIVRSFVCCTTIIVVVSTEDYISWGRGGAVRF